MASALVELSKALADAVEHAGGSVVAIKEGGRSGVSGTVWQEGVVVAADHTVRGREQLTVGLPSGQTTSATFAGGDPSTDLAVLKLGGGSVRPAEFADPRQMRVGNIVLAVARQGKHGISASHGVISALGGEWRTWHGGRVDQWLRLDLSPYPGFSGGPLVDAEGKVIGVNTSGPRRSVLTLPKSTVDRVVKQLLQKGRIIRGYIGLGVQPVAVSEALQKSLSLAQERALLVVNVARGGPADKAGVIVGDIILSVAGHEVGGAGDLLAQLDPESVGQAIPLRILRGGKPSDVKVTIGERGGE